MSAQPNKSGPARGPGLHEREITPALRRRALMRVAVQLAWICVALAFLLSVRDAIAAPVSDSAATEQVRATLIPSVRAVFPGQTLTLGVQQQIIPHWHTYWINPGDSGLPTRIDWTLPAGATAGTIQWPLPSHFDVEGITNYGYADAVTLLTNIVVPRDIVVGSKFPVQATVNWLVCAELCIPQKVELALTLPVVATAADAGPRNPQIDAVRALLPQASLWPLRVEIAAGDKPTVSLRIVGAADSLARASEIWFYADSWGRVQHNAPQTHRRDGADVVLDLPPGENPPTAATELGGVLVVAEELSNLNTTKKSDAATKAGDKSNAGRESNEGIVVRRGFALNAAALTGSPQTVDTLSRGVAENTAGGLATLAPTLLLALLGGVILNLMPCVFPVLSIKALALLKYANYTRAQIRVQGLVYTAGVLTSFGLLAAILIVLKTGGTQVGWGFQYQSPLFVVAVAYLLFAVGLNLSGLFSIGNSVTGVGSSLAGRPGYSGSFFSGVLAAIVATPCTAPFMGAAIGYALTQPALPLLAVFLSLGLGLALPYLLLTWWPALQRRLPRPGAWMERLKQLLAFPMYFAAVWLLWVLARQAGPDAVALALLGIVGIGLAAWIYQQSRASKKFARRAGAFLAFDVLLFAAFVGYRGAGVPVDMATADHASAVSSATPWENYSAQRLAELRADGKPVFVNFTASWCISCLVNERVALQQPVVGAAFKQQGISYLKGDWTNQDSEIAKKLAEFGRSGVPLYLFFPRGTSAEPVVLPQILTPDIVVSAITPAAVAAN